MLKRIILTLPRAMRYEAGLWATGRNTNRFIANNSVYEPNYLDSLKPAYPQYKTLNVEIRGYDYPILESYQRFLHGVAEYLEINVSDCYALPPQQMQVQRLRSNSTTVDTEFQLTMYERNIHLMDVNSPIYPIFLKLAQSVQPEGVFFQVQEYTSQLDDRRYVPDRDLLELKTELDSMQIVNKKSKTH